MPQCAHGWGWDGIGPNTCPQCNGAAVAVTFTATLPVVPLKSIPAPIVELAQVVLAGKSRSYYQDAQTLAQWVVDNKDCAEAMLNYKHAVANLDAVQTRCTQLYEAARDLWQSAAGDTVKFSDFKAAAAKAWSALFTPDVYTAQLGHVYDCPHCRVKNSTAHPAIWCRLCSQFCTPPVAPR